MKWVAGARRSSHPFHLAHFTNPHARRYKLKFTCRVTMVRSNDRKRRGFATRRRNRLRSHYQKRAGLRSQTRPGEFPIYRRCMVLLGLLITLHLADFKDGGGAAYFVRDDDQGTAVRAVVLADEEDAFRAEIAGFEVSRILVEVAVVDILDELGCGWLSDVIDHQATDALEADEGIGAAGYLADGDAFGLGALVVAAAVELVFIVVGVEEGRVDLGDDLFELVAAVPDEFATRVANGERAGTVGIDFLVESVAIGIALSAGGFQAAQISIILETGREDCGIEREVPDALGDFAIAGSARAAANEMNPKRLSGLRFILGGGYR